MIETSGGPDKPFPVSWDQFHRDARALAWRLHATGPFDAIVCITRGGLVPAAIVSRELDLRVIETISIVTYRDYKTQAEPEVVKSVESKLLATQGEGILVVDDLVDTGTTGKVVREKLPGAHFATVYAKPAGKPIVDSYITEVSQDTWIMFPWDTELQLAKPIAESRKA